MRNSWAVEVQRNRFAHNGAHGVELYARRLWDQPGRDLRCDPYQVRLDLVLAHNWFTGNRSSALSLRNPEQLDLQGLYRASGSARAPAEPLRLGGELRLLADAIGDRLAAAGGVRIRGRQSPEPDDRLAFLPR